MRRLFILAVFASAFLAPSAAFAGVVVKVQRSSHLAAVATTTKHVVLVHTGARLKVGERVALSARRLRNGTFAARAVRVVGRAHRLRFQGLVLASSHSKLVVSAGGAVITVHRGAVRSLASAKGSGPAPGSTVDVTATVGKDGELDDEATSTVSQSAPGGQIEGTLTIGTGSVTVTSEEMSLILAVPSGLDLSAFANGDEVLATFTQNPDGSLVLSALAGDETAAQADSAKSTSSDDGDRSTGQSSGDQSGSQSDGGSQSGADDAGSGGGDG